MVCDSHLQSKFPTYKDLRYIRYSLVLLICVLLFLPNASLGVEEADHQARAYRTAMKIKGIMAACHIETPWTTWKYDGF